MIDSILYDTHTTYVSSSVKLQSISKLLSMSLSMDMLSFDTNYMLQVRRLCLKRWQAGGEKNKVEKSRV